MPCTVVWCTIGQPLFYHRSCLPTCLFPPGHLVYSLISDDRPRHTFFRPCPSTLCIPSLPSPVALRDETVTFLTPLLLAYILFFFYCTDFFTSSTSILQSSTIPQFQLSPPQPPHFIYSTLSSFPPSTHPLSPPGPSRQCCTTSASCRLASSITAAVVSSNDRVTLPLHISSTHYIHR